MDVPLDMNDGALIMYNKMHADYRVRVEWGIGGLKRKFWRLMKQFDVTKPSTIICLGPWSSSQNLYTTEEYILPMMLWANK